MDATISIRVQQSKLKVFPVSILLFKDQFFTIYAMDQASTNGVYANEVTVLVTLPLDVHLDTGQHWPRPHVPKGAVYQEWSVPCFSMILWQQISFGCPNSAVTSSHSSPVSYEALRQPRRQGLVIFRKQARHVVRKSINQTAIVWTFCSFQIMREIALMMTSRRHHSLYFPCKEGVMRSLFIQPLRLSYLAKEKWKKNEYFSK